MDGYRDCQPFFAYRGAADLALIFLSDRLLWIAAESCKQRSHILHIKAVWFDLEHSVELLHNLAIPPQSGIEVSKLAVGLISIIGARFLPDHAVEIFLSTFRTVES